jgi:hypothetical protein
VTIDVNRLTDRLAADPRITDYDLWRALRDLDDALYALDRSGDPIPIDVLRLRAAVRRTRAKKLRRER